MFQIVACGMRHNCGEFVFFLICRRNPVHRNFATSAAGWLISCRMAWWICGK